MTTRRPRRCSTDGQNHFVTFFAITFVGRQDIAEKGGWRSHSTDAHSFSPMGIE